MQPNYRQLEDAIEQTIKGVLADDDDSRLAWKQTTIHFIAHERTHELVEVLERLTCRNADNLQLLILLADCYCGDKQFDAAIETCRRAIELDAADLSAHKALADTFIRAKNNESAAAALRPECFGDNIPPELALYSIQQFVSGKDPAIAATQLTSLLAEHPNFYAGWQELFSLSSQLERWKERGQIAERLLKLQPNNALSWARLGDVQLHAGELTAATQVFIEGGFANEARSELAQLLHRDGVQPFVVSSFVKLCVQEENWAACESNLLRLRSRSERWKVGVINYTDQLADRRETERLRNFVNGNAVHLNDNGVLWNLIGVALNRANLCHDTIRWLAAWGDNPAFDAKAAWTLAIALWQANRPADAMEIHKYVSQHLSDPYYTNAHRLLQALYELLWGERETCKGLWDQIRLEAFVPGERIIRDHFVILLETIENGKPLNDAQQELRGIWETLHPEHKKTAFLRHIRTLCRLGLPIARQSVAPHWWRCLSGACEDSPRSTTKAHNKFTQP